MKCLATTVLLLDRMSASCLDVNEFAALLVADDAIGDVSGTACDVSCDMMNHVCDCIGYCSGVLDIMVLIAAVTW